MFEYIIHSSIFIKTIITCCALGLISWLVLEISFISMARSTAHMAETKKIWLLALKKRFEDYHEMSIKVNNMDSFVDKLFRKRKLCGLPTAFWVNMERLAIAGCAISGAAGAFLYSQLGHELNEVMSCYLAGITAACSLLFLDTFLRINEKKQIVKNNISNYLENVMENSLAGEKTVEDMETDREYDRRIMQEIISENRKTLEMLIFQGLFSCLFLSVAVR